MTPEILLKDWKSGINVKIGKIVLGCPGMMC